MDDDFVDKGWDRGEPMDEEVSEPHFLYTELFVKVFFSPKVARKL